MNKSETFSNDTFRILRAARLTANLPKDLSGMEFVRCPAPSAELARKAATEIGEKGVFWSFCASTGDYLRINANTEAFRLVCWLKS